MATGYNKPRNLDYVHFTRVDNSASINLISGTSGESMSPLSFDILAKIKMMTPHLCTIVLAVAVLTAFVITVSVSVMAALIISGSGSSSQNRTTNDSQIPASPFDGTATLTTTTITESSSSVHVSSSPTESTTVSSSSSLSPSSLFVLNITQSVSPSCQSSEFACLDAKCIPLKLVCDGFPDCVDGSDERVSCECSDNQFRCPSGQCVPSSAVCDETYDCLDKGDEANCPDCAGFRCVSNNVCLWDRMAFRCNQIFDCEDYSDEMNCSARSGRHICSNGVQIVQASVCDGLDDCGDNSDEQNCVCRRERQFACSGTKGKCITSSWVCDGHPDCENKTDEQKCDECSDGYFRCHDYTCVNSSLRCDGKVDCTVSGGDEDGCVELTPQNELRALVENTMLPVCTDGWTDKLSDWICNSLHKRMAIHWTRKPSLHSGTKFAALKTNNGFDTFHSNEACRSQAIVHIKCQESECGERKVDLLEPFVAGGNVATLGKWPWVISLSYLGKPICGGVLIGTRWALTAAHCLMHPTDGSHYFSSAPFYFTVTAGAVTFSAHTNTINSSESNNNRESQLLPQLVKVSKIIFHPNRTEHDNGGVDWDIALLKLETDVRMSDIIQPVCLPDLGQVFPLTSYCYVAGWGILNFRQYFRSTQLRDARMQLWSDLRCRGNTVVGEMRVNTESTLCAGYMFGRPTACQGDSGGPLMCLDTITDRYTLAGIVSRGSDKCGQSRPYTHSNRFARVAMAMTWIQEIVR